MCALKQHHPGSAPENDSPPNFVLGDDTENETKNLVFSNANFTENAPVASRTLRAPSKRRNDSRSTSAIKKRAATKTPTKTLSFTHEEKEEFAKMMDYIPSAVSSQQENVQSNQVPTGQPAVGTNTLVLLKDQGQNFKIDWLKIESNYNQIKAMKQCTVLDFELVKKFDNKTNPFVLIILNNLKDMICNKCLAEDSTLENRGRDKLGTVRFRCKKCNSTGSIKTYANTIPFTTIKAIISSLDDDLAEVKKALTWCNLVQMDEENETEFIPFTVLPLSGQVKSLMNEVSALRLELQAAKDEIKRLKAPPAEKKRSFVEAAIAKPMQTQPAAKPMVIVRQKMQQKQLPAVTDGPAQKPRQKSKPISDMMLVFFKGVSGVGPAKLRQDMSKNGFEGHMVKDITYLTQDIVQILTYADKANMLAEAMNKMLPTCRREVDFDPLDPVSYSLPDATKENVLKAYTSALDQSVKRLKKCIVAAPSLTRSMNFLAKVVATGNYKYASAPQKPSPPLKFVSFFEKALAKSSNGPAGDALMNPAINDQ